MVQYIFTPWRDRRELLLVRDQLYGDRQLQDKRQQPQQTDTPPPPSQPQQKQQRSQNNDRRTLQNLAVARISMWVQRGNCPHMVESTALLFAAVLSDEIATTQSAGSSTYAVRAAYSAAFSRFVTGLLDGHQDKLRKQSMYSIAKVIGLPATFVELRHQVTHEQLPTLAKLRAAAEKALDWIWDYYWEQLSHEGSDKDDTAVQDPCKEAVLRYLREEDELRRLKIINRELSKWELEKLMATIKDLQTTLPGNQVYLKLMKLRQDLLVLEKERLQASPAAIEIKTTVLEVAQPTALEPNSAQAEELDDGSDIGWSRYQGQWKSKPIGIV